MSPAERGKKVVKRVGVRHVDRCQIEVRLIAIRMELVILSDRNIEQVSWSDTRRVVIVAARARCWNLQQRRTKL